MDVETISRVCHEVNRAYCYAMGDYSELPYDDSPDWQKESSGVGVRYHLDNPNSKPSDSHESWLKEKLEKGWKYGPVKDPEKKEHPCCVPYDELPAYQKAKDYIFLAIVRSLERYL